MVLSALKYLFAGSLHCWYIQTNNRALWHSERRGRAGFTMASTISLSVAFILSQITKQQKSPKIHQLKQVQNTETNFLRGKHHIMASPKDIRPLFRPGALIKLSCNCC
ncbi:hypothetical protein ANANG_G00281930 [Anguilla anguilla]|uniref:Uncharacterized protein n=1 Tax=Anguilla anguilla TaxID=7936 RepID=A0A9D3LNP7_ANGAN|nr:hypothetical protein ANANG_G00281930 [Anguilla anguilla]